jgi:hypothetical protein
MSLQTINVADVCSNIKQEFDKMFASLDKSILAIETFNTISSSLSDTIRSWEEYSLDLSDNEEINDYKILDLVNTVNKNNKIKILFLKNIGLTDESIDDVCQLQHVEVLDISQNNFTENGVKTIRERRNFILMCTEKKEEEEEKESKEQQDFKETEDGFIEMTKEGYSEMTRELSQKSEELEEMKERISVLNIVLEKLVKNKKV